MRFGKYIFGFAALSAAFGFEPAFAIPPPPADSSLDQAREAVGKLKPILGDWKFTQSYTDNDRLDTTNEIELRAVQIDYIVYISVMYNNTLAEFYTIEYDSYKKSYRIFLGGVEYIGGDPALGAVDLDVSQNGISWTLPRIIDGKADPSQASAYSIQISGDQLIENEDVPSWPYPKRHKTVYTFHRQ